MNSVRSLRRRGSRGYTLSEVLVTVFIIVIVMISLTSVMIALQQQSGYRFAALGSVDQVRIVGKQFMNEVRNAQTGSDGSYAITQASTTQVIFFSAFGTNNSATVRRIRYYYSATSSILYKGVITPTGNPLTYNVNAEVIKPVVTNVLNGTTTTFTYFDGAYAGTSSALTQPVNLTRVSYIKMNLKVLQQDARKATSTYSFSSGSAIRSLKTNLGN